MIAGLPYDAEIEYLESTGTQYIDTGVLIGPSITITGRIRPLGLGQHILGSADAVEHPVSRISIQPASNNRMSWIYALNNTNSLIAYLPTTPLGLDIDFTCGPSSAVYNGISVSQTSWTQVPQSTSATLGLFARIAHVTTGLEINYASVRFYSCKITQGNTLVRDFIPVRVGQTGYMYDRVSRRLFGNKGTGSFVLGPDVAKPVMGLWGMRKFYSTTDYIRDGLVAMWDGIDNAGWGTHDNSATTWKDLKGSRDWALGPQASYEWTSISLDAKNQNAATMPFVDGELVTAMEFCVKTKMTSVPEINSAFVLIGREYSSLAPYYGLLYRNNTSGGRNLALMGGRAYYSGTYTLYAGRLVSIAFPDYANTGGAAYFDGAAMSASGANTLDYNATTRGTVARIGGIASVAMPIEVYCIRLYSRALSPAEIAHNYAIDKARFNLP